MSSNTTLLKGFLFYIEKEKGVSKNTISAYQSDINQFFVAIKDKDIKLINQNDINAWITVISASSPATQKRKIIAVKSLVKYAIKNKVIKDSIVLDVEVTSKRSSYIPSFLTSEELDIVLNKPIKNYKTKNLEERDRMVIWLLIKTGMRRSEIINLDIIDIVFKENKIIIREAKGNKFRFVFPEGNKIFPMLKRYINYREETFATHSPALFLSYTGERIDSNGVHRLWIRHFKRCGINKNISLHGLRHSFATHVLDRGIPINQVRDQLGHSSIATTSIYAHDNLDLRKKSFQSL